MGPYRVLSLDGGGMRGVFTARLLERLAEARPGMLERANLIAGTSTGGILALGLADGRSPEALRWLYRENGRRIFDDSFWDDLRDLGRATGADYDLRGLRQVLREEFGERRLRDLRTKVLIPAFDLDAPAEGTRPRMWKPKFFHNFAGPDSDGRESIVDVALRTSAAPTYFPTYQGYVDGGVVANNPSVAALAQALSPRGGRRKLEEIVLLSLGTGSAPRYVRGSRLDWGFGQWARPLVSLIVSGTMGVADYECRQLLGRRYRRLTRYFDRAVEMDDTRPGTLDYLERQADAVSLRGTLRWLERRGW